MNVQLQAASPALLRLQRHLRSESGSLFAGLMLANAIAYGYHVIMARMVSPAEYGVLVTLTSVSYVLAVLMRTIQAWVIKAACEPRGAGPGRVRAVMAAAGSVLLPLAAVTFAAHWLASGWVASFLHLGAATPVVVLGLYTCSSFVVPIPRGVLLALNRVYLASLVHIVEPLVRVAAGVALVALGLGVNGALTGYAAGNLLAFAVGMAALWPLLRRPAPEAPAAEERVGRLDRYALLVLLTNTCLMVMASADQVAIKRLFSEEVAGNYAVAFLLGRIIVMSTMSLGWVIFTRSATLSPGDPRRARVLVTGLLATGAISATLTGGYIIAPALAVSLMGGAQYSIAASFVGLVGAEMTLFSLLYIQVYYLISVRAMAVVWPLCLGVALEVALLAQYHETVQQVLLGLIAVMAGMLAVVSPLAWRTVRAGAPRGAAQEQEGAGDA